MKRSVYLLVLMILSNRSSAQWSTDPSVNNAISTASGSQIVPTIVSDGSGGAIITWRDTRGASMDIYAQQINASGEVQWTADGVAICAAGNAQTDPIIISDGSDGAVIAWEDLRSGNRDIYAQRINASGLVQWTADGVAICAASYSQEYLTALRDGSGGAIITWEDLRNGNGDRHIYAQRVNATGVVQWATDGVAICVAGNVQDSPVLVNDGSSGAIITWKDQRGGDGDIYAQRIDASGVVQWTANGVAICAAGNNQSSPGIVTDGSGGAIITWIDERSVSYDIYAQRINASGVVQWIADGVAICAASDRQDFPAVVGDGSGGAIITWGDLRSGNRDIYAQRVNASGVIQWTADGVAITIAGGDQTDPAIVSDGSSGAIVTWGDYRNGSFDIYAQRINGSGAFQWTADGVAISTASGNQSKPQTVNDGSGGAIITWQDARNGNSDIYAQRIRGVGLMGGNLPSYCRSGVNKAIPDNNPAGARDTLTISGVPPGHVVQGIAVKIDSLTHTWVGDLRMTLSHNGITRTLMNRPGTGGNGSNGDNFVGTVLADFSHARIDSIAGEGTPPPGGPPFTGSFRPDSGGAPGIVPSSLDSFIGSDPNGQWILFVNDNASQDSGMVHAWCLELQTAPPPPATFCRSNVNKAIPDVNPSGVRDTLGISGITPGHVVQSIALRIDSLTHSFVGDLTMTLSHNGITRTLMSRPGTGSNGSSGNNFIGTVLVDSATRRIDSIFSTDAPFTGFFRPDSGGAPSIVPSTLAPFIGSNPNGDWVLSVTDLADGDSGKIHSWCLILQTGISTDVDPVDRTVPEVFVLEQNYPNPFNPTTTIRFALPVAAHVTLKIYNVLGQEVATLVDEPQNAGTFNAIWNGRSYSGLSVASGVYFYQLVAKSSNSPEVFPSIKKMLLLK